MYPWAVTGPPNSWVMKTIRGGIYPSRMASACTQRVRCQGLRKSGDVFMEVSFQNLQLIVHNPMCPLYHIKSPGQLISQAVTRAKVVQVGILGEEPLL